MTFTADESVISGECYTVVEVGGHRPAVRADFARATAMTLLRNGQTRRVIGAGVETSGTVRFHQKEPGPAGKDIRVWTITVRGDMFLGARTRILKRVPTDDPVHGRDSPHRYLSSAHRQLIAATARAPEGWARLRSGATASGPRDWSR